MLAEFLKEDRVVSQRYGLRKVQDCVRTANHGVGVDSCLRPRRIYERVECQGLLSVAQQDVLGGGLFSTHSVLWTWYTRRSISAKQVVKGMQICTVLSLEGTGLFLEDSKSMTVSEMLDSALPMP